MAKKRKTQAKAKAAKANKAAKASKKAQATRERPTRAERFEEARRRRNRRVLIGRVAIAGGLAVIIIGIAGFVVINRMREAAWISSTESGTCSFDREADGDAGAGNNHVENAAYRVEPPAGGNHAPQAASAGVFHGGSVPDDGQLVHALEHGFVILWHDPDLPEDDVEQVLDVHGEFERDVLVVPRATLPVPVAATAWHQRLLCDEVEPDALATFVRNTRNKGPERVPH